VHSKHTLHSLNACMGQDEENFLAKFLALFVSEVLRIYLLLATAKWVAQKGVSCKQ
jgi:hypothetical protein